MSCQEDAIIKDIRGFRQSLESDRALFLKTKEELEAKIQRCKEAKAAAPIEKHFPLQMEIEVHMAVVRLVDARLDRTDSIITTFEEWFKEYL